MNYKITEAGGTAAVVMDGQLNFASNEDFQTLLINVVAHKPTRVVFDMAALTMIDSVGLGLLYIANEDLQAAGAKLALTNVKGAVKRLLDLTEASKTFEIIG